MSELRELAREHPEEFRNVAEYVGPKTRERMLEILKEEHGGERDEKPAD